jgi:hypothetical protein
MSSCADCTNHTTGVVRRTGWNRHCPVTRIAPKVVRRTSWNGQYPLARIALTMLPAWFVERVGIDIVQLRGLR